MIIRNHPIAPRRGNKPLAQGSALGKGSQQFRPVRAKAMLVLLPLQGEVYTLPIPRAMHWAMCFLAFQAVCRIHVDNH